MIWPSKSIARLVQRDQYLNMLGQRVQLWWMCWDWPKGEMIVIIPPRKVPRDLSLPVKGRNARNNESQLREMKCQDKER